MNTTQLTITKAGRSLLTRFCLVTASFALTTTSVAATNENIEQDYNKTSTVYADSVLQWGPWELDIEPAAGGLQAQTTQALNARDSKVRLRTNSMSALAPQQPGTVTPPPAPLPVKSPAPLPIAPPAPLPIAPPPPRPAPTLTPIGPGVPVPIGGPGDGF